MRIDVDIMKDQFKIGNRVRVDGEVYFIRYISSPMSKKGQLIQELELEHTWKENIKSIFFNPF